MRQAQLASELNRPQRMNSDKFLLWLIMASVVMVFAALTSAYIVKRAEGGWDNFPIPSIFYLSTLIMLLSSGTMHWAVTNARNNEINRLRLGVSVTAILGIAFLGMQIVGWSDLIQLDVYFSGGNVAGSFFYVITVLHWLHIVAGLIFLAVALIQAFKFKIHSKSMNLIEMCATFWHFLDGLWIYLFLFLLFLR